MSNKKNEKLMSIGQISQRLGIHEQTIRAYERKGLITPHRSEKKTRAFSELDITRLITITLLTQEIGLNIAGVKILFDFAKFNNLSDEELLDYIDDYKSKSHQNKLRDND